MKKLNRICLIVIITALFSLLVCLPAHATNETAAIQPSINSASTGDVITFTVSISNVKSARGIAVIPTYDTDAFDLVSGEWLLSGSLSDFSVTSGDGVIALGQATDIDEAIFTFSLKVKGSVQLGMATVGCNVIVSNSSGSNISLDASDRVEIVCRHSFTKQDTSEAYLKSPADCTNKAVYYFSCEYCGAKGTETFETGTTLEHNYDQQNVTAAYLKSGATCTAKAVYYYSCTCGAKGTETFEYGAEPSHNYKTVWSSNSSAHWHECSKCGDRKDSAAHVPGAAATETSAQTCTVCGYVIVPALGHEHNYQAEWSYNTEIHWHACIGCEEHKDEAAHTFDNACDTTCNICGYTRVITHSYNTEWSTNETTHWYECKVCGDKKDVADHTPGAEATETTDQIYTVCGYVINAALGHTHNFGTEWNQDADHHWHECSCGEKLDVADHIPGAEATETTDQICTVCGYVINAALGHTHDFDTEWNQDVDHHWHECSCGEKIDISVHTPGEWIIDKEAAIGVEGAKHKECTECGQIVEEAVIEAVSDVNETASEATTEPGDNTPTQPDDHHNISTLVIIIVVAVIVIGGVAALLIVLKKKH